MLNDKTNKFLEKIANQNSTDATGMSQYKQRIVEQKRRYPAMGAGVGGALGLATGHLVKQKGKWGLISKLVGLGAGTRIGKGIGELGTITKTKTREGVVKKQQKHKAPGAKAKVPELNDAKVLKLLRSN